MSILRGHVEIKSSCYNLSSGMSGGSMNGEVWTSLVGWILGGGGVYGGSWYRCSVYGSQVGLGGVCGFVGLVCLTSYHSSSELLFSVGVFFASRVPLRACAWLLAHLVSYAIRSHPMFLQCNFHQQQTVMQRGQP